MRRFSLIAFGCGLLLLAGAAWLWLGERSIPDDFLPETATDEPTDLPIEELFATVLGDMPVRPDIVQSGEAWLALETTAEAKDFDMQVLAPLSTLKQIGESLRASLTAGETNWCATYLDSPYIATNPDLQLTDELYRERLDEERSVRTAGWGGSSQDEAWNDWLLRLSEAAADKSDRKKAEQFQERFNTVTDEYEAVVTESLAAYRSSVDTLVFSQSAEMRLPQQLFRKLDLSLTSGQSACDSPALSPSERALLLGRISQWQESVERTIKRAESVKGSIVTRGGKASDTLAKALAPSVRTLEQTIGALQSDTL